MSSIYETSRTRAGGYIYITVAVAGDADQANRLTAIYTADGWNIYGGNADVTIFSRRID